MFKSIVTLSLCLMAASSAHAVDAFTFVCKGTSKEGAKAELHLLGLEQGKAYHGSLGVFVTDPSGKPILTHSVKDFSGNIIEAGRLRQYAIVTRVNHPLFQVISAGLNSLGNNMMSLINEKTMKSIDFDKLTCTYAKKPVR